MLEIQENLQNVEIKKSLEHPTFVFYERLKDSRIRTKLIDDYFLHQNSGGILVDWVIDEQKHDPERPRKTTFLSKDDVASYLDILIPEIFTRTGVSYDLSYGNQVGTPTDVPGEGFGSVLKMDHSRKLKAYGGVYLKGKNTGGEFFTKENKSAAEAHEKGHVVRFYMGDSDLTKKFAEAIDLEKVTPTAEEYKQIVNMIRISMYSGATVEDQPDEKMYADFLEYLKDPLEIMERMSDIKNYLGFKDDQRFTIEHLKYIRVNYVKSGASPVIGFFVKAITAEKENIFIDLMNNHGI